MSDFIQIYNLAQIKEIIENKEVSKELLNTKIMIPNSESKGAIFWRVIDVNHDGTNNTIDVQSDCNAIPIMRFCRDKRYKDSDLRKWLNGIFYNAFLDLAKDLIIPMEVDSDGEKLVDNVKVISMTEIGLEDYFPININQLEGSPYPIYAHFIKYNYNDHNHYIDQFTRSSFGDTGKWIISDTGAIAYKGDYYECGAAPIIRLGLKE